MTHLLGVPEPLDCRVAGVVNPRLGPVERDSVGWHVEKGLQPSRSFRRVGFGVTNTGYAGLYESRLESLVLRYDRYSTAG